MRLSTLLNALTRADLLKLCDTREVVAQRSLRKSEIVDRLVAADLTAEGVLRDLDSRALAKVRRSLGLPPRVHRKTILAALPSDETDLPGLVTRAISDLRREWWPFSRARDFVRQLELRGTDDWKAYCAGALDALPPRPWKIPAQPHVVYAGQGWKDYRDWLGLGPVRARREDPYWSFHRARSFVRELGLESNREWRAYVRNELRESKGARPDYIPSSPDTYYPEWVSWGDWLGTGRTYRLYARPFEEARSFARSLGLESQGDWGAWCRGERPDLPPRPRDIPTNPHRHYDEWKGLGDWLGTRRVATQARTTVSYQEAQRMAQERGFTEPAEWSHWWHWRRPKGVPAKPDAAYAEEWEGWHAFLGVRAPDSWLGFEKARTYARSLGLESESEWQSWCRGERDDLPERPPGIPTNPHRTYAGDWVSMGDWLGTGRVATQHFQAMPWDQARSLVRRLEFRNQGEFKAWVAGRSPDLPDRPRDLPTNPDRSYSECWEGWGDFLGTGTPSREDRSKQFWTFRRAKAFVHKLNLRNEAEWRDWLRGRRPELEPRPAQIPTAPEDVYRDRGWQGFGDWLGSGYVHHSRREYLGFEEAWDFVKSLGLRSKSEWELWCKGALPGRPPRPSSIHTNPRKRYPDRWPGWRAWLGNG